MTPKRNRYNRAVKSYLKNKQSVKYAELFALFTDRTPEDYEAYKRHLIKLYIKGHIGMTAKLTFCDKRYGLTYDKYIKGYSNWFSKPMGDYKKRRVCLATGNRSEW